MIWRTRRLVWLIAMASAASLARAQSSTTRQAMDFEEQAAWRTAPELLREFDEGDLWSTRTIPFARLAGGIQLSGDHVKSGRFSARWRDHPRYPTIHTHRAPRDWSDARALQFWVYSEVVTGEIVTLAILSDGAHTPWKDFFLFDFEIDWTGWRRLRIPLADFRAFERPAGWNQVDGIYFFTKIFDRQPNPYTDLCLDGMQLTSETREATRPAAATASAPDVASQVPAIDRRQINHRFPELRSGQSGEAPITYASYFKTERALYGYFPRFHPGFVSFDPGGRAYLQYGSYLIETLAGDGRWRVRDLLPSTIGPYLRHRLHYQAPALGNTGQVNDASIRFDGDGDAYMMCYVSDQAKDWRSRRCLLLHSRDSMETWEVYQLPHYMARFEKVVSRNSDCLHRPPVILMSDYFSPTTNYITVPEKRPDGSLHIPPPVKVADHAIGFIPHSGEANQAITHGDKVFIVYGRLQPPPGHDKQDGAPAYAAVYDIRTRKLSAPVLIGFGGIDATDGHNWPAVVADSRGILHVIINGHHNPFTYTHSTKPWSIEEWTKPVRVAKGTSYCGLVCDSRDVLYTVSRNSAPGYYFRLSLHRKRPGQPWEPPRHLVIPFKAYYKIWYHKLVIEPKTDRLFLAYYSQSASLCLFKDEYLAYLYIWPHREKSFMTEKPENGQPRIPLGSYRQRPRKYQFYSAPPSEMTILASSDGGDSWRLAVTEDFR